MENSLRDNLEKRGDVKNGVISAAKLSFENTDFYSLRKILLGPFALEVKLEKLVCHETEDFFGHDHVALDIFADEEYEKTLTKKMNNGDVWHFRDTFLNAKDKLAIHLYDKDLLNEDTILNLYSLDQDDLLGSHIIYSHNLTVGHEDKIKFKKDGANYDLFLTIRIKCDFPRTAKEIVQEFASRRREQVWTKFSRGTVAAQLEDRIDSPKLINQGPTAFCGPASVLYEFAHHMPKRYVNMVIDLFEKGKWKTNEEFILAPSSLLDKEIPVKTYESGNQSQTPAADWIALTSMRDTANVIFNLDETNDSGSNVQAGALAYEVAAWCPLLLGWRNIDIYTTTTFGRLGFRMPLGLEFFFQLSGDAIDGIYIAKETLRKGGSAMIQINSDLLDYETDESEGTSDNPEDIGLFHSLLPNISSHFVSLYDPFARVRNGRVFIRLYTWGGKREIDITEEGFEREVFAYVLAKPGAPV